MSRSKPFSRLLEIMDIVSLHPSGATMTELVEQLELPKSTTYRLVKTLVEEDYLQGQGRHGRYRLGRRFIRQYHNSASSKQLVDQVRPVLRQLCNQFDEVVNMNRLLGDQIRPVSAEFPRSNNTRAMIMPGDSFPIHATASGKVICAYQPLEIQQRMLNNNRLTRFRPNTITDPEALTAELEQVKQQGYAVIDDELDKDVLAVSVPIQSGTAGVVYSLGLVGFHQRMLENHDMPVMVKQLKLAANEISQLLESARLI